MERAQPAPISFIREPRTGIIDLKYMPVSMLPKGGIYREDDGCKTLEEVQSDGKLKVVSFTSHSLHIEDEHFSRIIVEIMRADLNDDGIEDILVYWRDSSLQGTYKNGGTFILTRRAAAAPFERLSSWPEWKNPLELWYSDTTIIQARKEALIRELSQIIENDRYALSPRIAALKDIIARLRRSPHASRCPHHGITSRRAGADIGSDGSLSRPLQCP
jgi:hypothetical protein